MRCARRNATGWGSITGQGVLAGAEVGPEVADSKSYVAHIVKEASAVSFSDLLGYIRLAMAENLLLATRSTMLETAESCGFSDMNYFTRSFVDAFISRQRTIAGAISQKHCGTTT
jgi:transcriptional regulator GlxA family with amidase domain